MKKDNVNIVITSIKTFAFQQLTLKSLMSWRP